MFISQPGQHDLTDLTLLVDPNHPYTPQLTVGSLTTLTLSAGSIEIRVPWCSSATTRVRIGFSYIVQCLGRHLNLPSKPHLTPIRAFVDGLAPSQGSLPSCATLVPSAVSPSAWRRTDSGQQWPRWESASGVTAGPGGTPRGSRAAGRGRAQG